MVCEVTTARPIPGLKVAEVHQEHGLVTATNKDSPLPFDDLPIGARVRVMPNHVCMTVAAYDAYNVIESEAETGGEIIATWGRCNGW